MISLILSIALQGAAVEGEASPQGLDDPKSKSAQIVEMGGEQPLDAVHLTPAEEPQATPPQTRQIAIPAKHSIIISIDGQVGSKISQAKDWFPIKLVSPVVIDGIELLPAGLTGEGQVIHADKAGFGGSAGELILAARYLEIDGRRIQLRSFKFIEEGDEILHRGKDNSDLTLATLAAIGLPGFLIGGGNTTIEPGTLAQAKLRNEEIFEIENNLEGEDTNSSPDTLREDN